MNQRTLKKNYSFKGKGLHTGKPVNMTVKPAPANTGVVFVRTDIPQSPVIEALACNVSKTDRSTSLCNKDGIAVFTVEHILSALTGLGVDNAIIELDNIEVPIMDGSARKYAVFIGKDGTVEQDAPRKFINIDKPIEITDPSGAYVKIEPAEQADYDLTIDFGSHVLGVQNAHWDAGTNYISQIAPCRTFCFFHEVEFMLANNLIKGGDIYNAIVVMEKPISDKQLQMMRDKFEMPDLAVTPKGYLNNIKLHFANECGRHKMLDLIGDLRLCGGFLNAKVTAYKSGHTINTAAARAILQAAESK
ncbi:MAG: UDP-3-O-[3-hydroxymyristoyl] N-acetylglucosamine deacetylase [Bacteroidales bacterium]|nr:UDP-3-O-[3-hydroxymyristoyl] N-acetylglucosamine deacetylase [Bacteroidales bacterium]